MKNNPVRPVLVKPPKLETALVRVSHNRQAREYRLVAEKLLQGSDTQPPRLLQPQLDLSFEASSPQQGCPRVGGVQDLGQLPPKTF